MPIKKIWLKEEYSKIIFKPIAPQPYGVILPIVLGYDRIEGENMLDKRPSRKTIHMKTAFLWAARSICKQPNRSIGCVITTEDMKRILAIGYNGPPAAMSNNSCRNISADCGCLHAEMNAIAAVDSTILNKVMFVTMEPCEMCASLISQANIIKVYFCEEYRGEKGTIRLTQCHIYTEKLPHPV